MEHQKQDGICVLPQLPKKIKENYRVQTIIKKGDWA